MNSKSVLINCLNYSMLGEVYDSIKKHRKRSIVTGFGISLGIFSLVILLGIANDLKD